MKSKTFIFGELEIKLSEYERKPPALVFITESWLSENDPLETFCIKGDHQLKLKPLKSGLRGGVAFYARCDVEYQILEFETKLECVVINVTSRDRHKSTPYLRLKNSKRTSKCQVFFYSAPGALKGGTLLDFLTSIVKYQKH